MGSAITTTEIFLIAMGLIFTVPYLIWRLLRTDYYAAFVVVQIIAGSHANTTVGRMHTAKPKAGFDLAARGAPGEAMAQARRRPGGAGMPTQFATMN